MQNLMEHGENIIELKNISFSYGNEEILRSIDLEIHRGDYFGVIGPNGGGKTTLLKIILGLFIPSNGEVKLFGKNIREFRDWYKIGYVSQKAAQIDSTFPMTVEGVVSMGRYGRKKPFQFLGVKDNQKITEALRHVEMEEYRTRLIGDLSGGQQQRVFIARALAGEPEIILLDEPTIGIDAKTSDQLYALLKKLNREMRLTLILVSHDLDMIEREATELFCLNRAAIYCGYPKEFQTHERYREYLREEHHHGHHHA